MSANLDRIMVVQSLAPDGPNIRRLERELVVAWESGAVPVVVLTKADLVEDAEAMAAEAREAAGADVHVVSGVTGEGVEELRSHVARMTTAMFGASGVGKSTLANQLVGPRCSPRRKYESPTERAATRRSLARW